MDVVQRELVMLQTADGKLPFEEWLSSIKSSAFEAAILARLARVEDGNFGDHKSVGQGVYELRIPKGPGLRVYYGLDGPRIVVLIGGGDKSSQSKDIKKAQELLKEYFNEK
jgi:putative addiction module killer protein